MLRSIDPNAKGGMTVEEQPVPEQQQRSSCTKISGGFGGLGSSAVKIPAPPVILLAGARPFLHELLEVVMQKMHVQGSQHGINRPLMLRPLSNLLFLLLLTLLITGAAVTTAADSHSALKLNQSNEYLLRLSPVYTRRLNSSLSRAGGLPCNQSQMASELSQQCVLKRDVINLTGSCCHIVLMIVDHQDKGCLCRVVIDWQLFNSDFGIERIWDMYQRCGGRGPVPKDSQRCDHPPPPPPPPPSQPHDSPPSPPSDGPRSLSTPAKIGIVLGAVVFVALVVILAVLLWNRVKLANDAVPRVAVEAGGRVVVEDGGRAQVEGGARVPVLGEAASPTNSAGASERGEEDAVARVHVPPR